MDLKEYKTLGENIDTHWYYLSKKRALLSFLGQVRLPEILDVGAGSGYFSRALLEAGVGQRAVCLDIGYTREETISHQGKPISFVRNYEKGSPQLILMMDVLEHVPDDVSFLKHYAEYLAPGGLILITVPAFNFLWSPHDLYLGHQRRYRQKKLKDTICQAGLVPIKSRYFFASLFPLVALRRLIARWLWQHGYGKVQSELKYHAPWINKVLTMIHEVERRFFFAFNTCYGLSIFCLCRIGRDNDKGFDGEGPP
jgi:SAM-dependent methyltransferase